MIKSEILKIIPLSKFTDRGVIFHDPDKDDIIKRNNLNVKDFKQADIISVSPYIYDGNGEYICELLVFDIDVKSDAGSLIKPEAKEIGFKIFETLGSPKGIIQTSKRGNGIHVLICTKPFTAFTKKSKRHNKSNLFKDFSQAICDLYPVDKSLFNFRHQVDLVVNNKLFPRAFQILHDNLEGKELLIDDELIKKISNASKRQATKGSLDRKLLRLIKKIADSAPGSRNDTLNRITFHIFQHCHIVGFNKQVVTDKIKDACEENGLLQDNPGGVNQTIESASIAGAENPINVNMEISPQISRDVIYNPETDHEADITETTLQNLNNNLYYLTSSKGFVDIGTMFIYETLLDAAAISRIRFYKEQNTKKDEKILKRITTYDSILNYTLRHFPIEMTAWKRKISDYITRPCLTSDKEIITESCFEKGKYAQIAVPENGITPGKDYLMDFLNQYQFMSDRSKIYAVASMITAVGSRYWSWHKPAYYFHALSQAGRNSGKTTLAKIACSCCSKEIFSISLNDSGFQNYDEIVKEMLPVFRKGARAVLLDNLPPHKAIFRWSKLDSWLTSPEWHARILNRSEVFNIENRILYTYTGNQVNLSEDLMSRTAVIVFQGKFKGDTHLRFDEENITNNLAHSAIEMIRKWVDADCPQYDFPDDVSSGIKYPKFWKDFSGILACNGLNFGALDPYEKSELTGQSHQHDEIMEILLGQVGTAKNLWDDNADVLKEVIFGYGNSRIKKLAQILMDLSKRHDYVKIIGEKGGKNKFQIGEPSDDGFLTTYSGV